MSFHIQSNNMDVWDAMVNKRFEPQVEVNGVVQIKHKANWTENDKKKFQYDLKPRNILISAICMNENQSITHCKTAKAMLDTLETLHKGNEDVKQSKSIFSSYNMNSFTWRMVKPSPPCK
jgi:hypothetical protein